MGHFHSTIQGEGKNRAEAQRDAVDKFLFENGHRHSVREIDHGFCVKRKPPLKMLERRQGRNIICSQVPDPKAPQDQWIEVWQFELHTHA